MREANVIYPFLWSCVAVFAFTLPVGVWASYDTSTAAVRGLLIVGGVGLLLLARGMGLLRGFDPARRMDHLESLVALLASFTAAAVGVSWLVFPAAINANVAGGAIAILLPFSAAAVLRALRVRRFNRLALYIIMALPAFVALVRTNSRGAWLALIAAALVVGLLALLGDRAGPATACLLTSGLVFLPFAVLTLALLWPDLAAVLGKVGSTTVSRPALWADMLAQLSDVPFTGSGLGATMMTDAAYVRLLHVGFVTHAHHLYVQIALEQGLLGLAAFIGIQGIALYLAIRAGVLPAIAGLTVLLVHGSVDAGLYAARAVPLVFFPAAAAVLLAGDAVEAASERSIGGWAVVAVALLLFVSLLPTVRAAFHANLGAVLQSRAELSRYAWPALPMQDVLRQEGGVDLSSAMARYEAALALDDRNATAHRRLGQIALARCDFDLAQEHFQAAYINAPGHRATRQYLGELLAVAGDASGALALWEGLDLSQGQLGMRRFWYDFIGDTTKSAAIREVQNQLPHGNSPLSIVATADAGLIGSGVSTMRRRIRKDA